MTSTLNSRAILTKTRLRRMGEITQKPIRLVRSRPKSRGPVDRISKLNRVGLTENGRGSRDRLAAHSFRVGVLLHVTEEAAEVWRHKLNLKAKLKSNSSYSSAETIGAVNTGFDTTNLHRPTEVVQLMRSQLVELSAVRQPPAQLQHLPRKNLRLGVAAHAKLNLNAKYESSSSSSSSLKHKIPGAFNTGFIGSTCTALPRLAFRVGAATY